MSDSFLRLIPVDPTFVPTTEAIGRARTLLRSMVLDQIVTSDTSDEVRFVDQGENFEQLRCPFCEAELDSEWWKDAMDRAYETHFENLKVRVPCCGRETSLNDLDYRGPAGFARFLLEVENPSGDELEAQYIAQLEGVLGTKLRQIRTKI